MASSDRASAVVFKREKFRGKEGEELGHGCPARRREKGEELGP